VLVAWALLGTPGATGKARAEEAAVPVLESFAVQKAEDGTVSFTSEVWSPAPDTAVLMTLHNAEGGVVRKLRRPCETEPCSVASEALRLPPGCDLVRVTAVDGSDGTSEEFTETFNIPEPKQTKGPAEPSPRETSGSSAGSISSPPAELAAPAHGASPPDRPDTPAVPGELPQGLTGFVGDYPKDKPLPSGLNLQEVRIADPAKLPAGLTLPGSAQPPAIPADIEAAQRAAAGGSQPIPEDILRQLNLLKSSAQPPASAPVPPPVAAPQPAATPAPAVTPSAEPLSGQGAPAAVPEQLPQPRRKSPWVKPSNQ